MDVTHPLLPDAEIKDTTFPQNVYISYPPQHIISQHFYLHLHNCQNLKTHTFLKLHLSTANKFFIKSAPTIFWQRHIHNTDSKIIIVQHILVSVYCSGYSEFSNLFEFKPLNFKKVIPLCIDCTSTAFSFLVVGKGSLLLFLEIYPCFLLLFSCNLSYFCKNEIVSLMFSLCIVTCLTV